MKDLKVTVEEQMDRERLLHAQLEKEINKDIDAEIERFIDNPILGVQMRTPFLTRPSNPSLFFIIPNELAERFCYYGFVPLLKNLFGKSLGLSKHFYGLDGKLAGETDNTIPNVYKLNFDVITYLTPIIGALISDSYLDKYKTILALGLFYGAGMFLLAFATNPTLFGFESVIAPVLEAAPLNETVVEAGVKFIPDAAKTIMPQWAIFLALGLIAFGTGGIKPCVSAHGGDQFLEKQTVGLNQFYSYFYMSINIGAFVSSYITPNIKAGSCFGNKSDCYSPAFFVCAGVFAFAYIWFAIGKKFYRVVPPAGRFIIWDLIKVSFARMFKGKEYAESVYGKSLLVEAADLGKVLLAILPTPIFWMGFNQNGATWQDSTDRLGVSLLTSEQVNAVVNPILVVILAPIFAAIYPRFPKLNLLKRMTIGYLFAAAAFVVCGLIDQYVAARCQIDPNLPIDDYYFGKCAYKELDNLIWIVPYFLITCGEVFVSISGLNFVYEEVGKRTKSSSTALWLLTSSAGSMIASQLTKALNPVLFATEKSKITFPMFYYICAGIILAATIPQFIIARYYVTKRDRPDGKLA
jgi:dipeptide/tripeptide permease